MSAIARVGCAVLAAGAGVRFGGARSKLVVPILGKPLLQWAVDAAAGSRATSCTLVLGAAADEVLAFVDPRRCAPVRNAQWREGMAASIRCAVAIHAGDDALVIALGDSPGVTAADLDGLIAAHLEQPDAIVALRTGDVWGVPVLFPRCDFSALAALRGDAGAKRVATAHRDRLRFVEARHADAFADVDVAADVVSPRGAR